MKKILLILVAFVVVLTGCNQKESENHKNTEKQATEESEQTGNTKNEMIKGLIEYGYKNDSYKGYEDMKNILSKKMVKQSDVQNQSAKTGNIEKEARDIKLYKNVDDNNNLIYTVKVGITNKKTKKSDYSIRYGKIEMKNEDGKEKIDNITELTKTNIPSMTEDIDY